MVEETGDLAPSFQGKQPRVLPAADLHHVRTAGSEGTSRFVSIGIGHRSRNGVESPPGGAVSLDQLGDGAQQADGVGMLRRGETLYRPSTLDAPPRRHGR